MDELKKSFVFIGYGLKDCFLGVLALRHFWSQTPKPQQHSKTDSPKTLFGVLNQCLVFGGLFWAGIFIFNRGILNFGVKYFELFLKPDERDGISWFLDFLGIIFTLFWTVPLFIISRVLNYKWYQEIADLTFESSGIKRGPPVSISYEMSDQIQSFAIQCLFMVQAYIMFVLPIPEVFKHVLFNLHLSLLYALYSFEYKWVQMGWSLGRRLAYMNAKWPYFLGFGLPLTIISSYFGTYIESLCIFSTLFPIYVVSSTVTSDKRVQNYGFPIKFFRPIYLIVDFFTVHICTFIRPAR